ncbi:hypothetical protein [[Eubacterium] hominis]|uniref:hypothetical protein n=1 Tax=[Eubacterium] hominis TaxID=2764325 RepID=UPI0022E10896
MIGIDSFKKYFKGFEKEYVIIGGTACELLMSENALPFRATKDIDMVLIIESLTKEFAVAFWQYVKEAEYRFINKGTGTAQFYRFSHPKSQEYPMMIEIFSKKQDWLNGEFDQQIVPIHIDDQISSLSAILLNEAYYEFLREGSEIIDGVSILKAEHIIPFKAKAWIDLSKRKENGESIDSRDIKKHKNDIFRLSMLLTPEQKIRTSDEIKEDLSFFIQHIKNEDINLKQLGIRGINKNDILDLLCRIYDLPPLQ